MALTSKRKAGGGRKPVVLPNPFETQDDWGDSVNVLWDTEDEVDIRIEDILVGCVRSFNADKKARQEFVNWQKLLRVYRNVCQFDAKSIADYLRCDERQARRYMQAIKLCNPFIERYMLGKSGSNIKGYVHANYNSVQRGYNPLGVELKEREDSQETNKRAQECQSILISLRSLAS